MKMRHSSIISSKAPSVGALSRFIFYKSDTGSLAGRLLYDKNGNLIGNVLNLKREYEYTYDYNNRLIQVSRYNSVNLKEVLISYTYDTLGRRTSKKVVNQLTEYIYSANDIIEETLSTLNPTSGVKIKKELREYVYGSKGMDDIVSVTITPYIRVNKVDVAGTGNTYYYEKDHLGSTTKITSSTGGIIDEYGYTVFGKAYKKNPDGIYKPVSSLKSAIGNTRLYTGREYDRETNLYYLRARYYDANLGRFISRDPIGMKDDINLYKYTRNSPVLYTDRDGRKSKTLVIPGIDNDGIETQFNSDGSAVVRDSAKSISFMYNILRQQLKGNFEYKIVRNFQEFDSAINEKQRDNVFYIGHGYTDSLVLNGDSYNSVSTAIFNNSEYRNSYIETDILNGDQQTLDEANRLRTTNLTLYSCHAGDDSDGISIANELKNHYGFETVTAPTKNITIKVDDPNKYGIYDSSDPSSIGTWKTY